MTGVRVSGRFQVVIPKPIRTRLGLNPGQRMQVFEKGGIVILVPEVPLSSMKGIVKGMDPTGVREKWDRKATGSRSE